MYSVDAHLMGRNNDLLLTAAKHLTDPNHQRKCVLTTAQPDPQSKTKDAEEIRTPFKKNKIVVTNSDLKIKSTCKSVPK